MNQSYYDALTCASILPAAGIDYNMFLRNLPNDETILATIPLLKNKVLRVKGEKITLAQDLLATEDLSTHENPSAMVLFLEGLVMEMASCTKIEENRVYFSVLQTFLNASKHFCGRNEELDDKLAEMLASLVNLLDEPMVHFVKKDMDYEAYDKDYLDVLGSAEASLALKTLDRGLEEEDDASRKLRLYRFTYDSLQAVSGLLHGPLGPNEATETVDELLYVLEEKISEWEPVAEIEVMLRELEKECGVVPDSE